MIKELCVYYQQSLFTSKHNLRPKENLMVVQKSQGVDCLVDYLAKGSEGQEKYLREL
jgi:hypothetical protein